MKVGLQLPSFTWPGGPAAIPGHLGEIADVIAAIVQQGVEGIEHVIVNMPDAEAIRPLESFGREIIPAVSELSVPA